MVEIPWDASETNGDPQKGQVVVELINMRMIECKHGWDLHEMGNIKQGDGGSEWVAVYDDQFIVRFTAKWAEIKYSTEGSPSVNAFVHRQQCVNGASTCLIKFMLPY